ncbi:transglutaminase domain-containing protein [Paenibacillus harenae]|uniref:transglutaminase domain-containing protein n=1 Tax=Paenibacillus harenae TaxID=306543 RepID=UPI00278FB95F|nr:transglutaminase domain-containing protein [Paenibacillus harenae]MDQ0060702.1 hypothetical protein [Paenibacillus harenae]
MFDWMMRFDELEPVAIIALLLLLVSLLQGIRRGASGSAKRLFFFVWEGIVVIAGLIIAGQLAGWASPAVAEWLTRVVEVPANELGNVQQAWFTLLTSLRDFALLRYGVLFLLFYLIFRAIAGFAEPLFSYAWSNLVQSKQSSALDELPGRRYASRATGALIGAVHGAGRAFLFIATLFIYVSLLPNGWYADKISESPLYREAASMLAPVAGDMLEGQGPVLAEAVEAQFRQILQRKYEIIDYAVPDDIAEAALFVTKDAGSDEQKARLLYEWLGTRIEYDWDKADNYVERGVWKEQTPADTFATRKGVCIDTARLYAVMARTAGLDVRVVTGLGADGSGGFGPHAWNEVNIGDGEDKWIPLDATWASSGDWFNSPGFEQTHIREAAAI